MLKDYMYDGEGGFKLSKMPTSSKGTGADKQDILEKTAKNQLRIHELQDRLYADGKEGLIILIQARDAAGKDGTIKHVMSGVNPQGVDVYSFKTPTHEETAHDFLWRFNKAIPVRGKIAIFNRSYYEDVLIVKVRELWKTYNVPERMKSDDLFDQRYKQIRNYESYLYQNGYRIVKIYLKVSSEEQKERFLERINTPAKNWKFSEGDIAERALWDEYTDAYEAAIKETATKDNPWYIIPADQKWFARYLVSEAIVKTMEEIDPQYPVLSAKEQAKLAVYRQALENEGEMTDDSFKASDAEVEAAQKQLKKETKKKKHD